MNNTTQLQALARAIALATAALGSSLPASAAFVTYTDQAAYQAALGIAPATDGFDDLVAGSALAGPLARSVGGVDYRASALPSTIDVGAEDLFPIAPAGNTALSTNFADASLLLDQFSQPLRGLGGLFFTSNEAGDASAGSLTLLLEDGDGGFSYTLPTTDAPAFLGFISDSAITSLKLSAAQSAAGYSYTALDGLSVAAAAAVPEPSALAMLALGTAALAMRSRRRRD